MSGGGGSFRLIANDGKVDRLLNATAYLNERIAKVEASRLQMGYADPTPELDDLEQSHVLYTVSHYKPFASITYEYQKVKTDAGSPTLGGSVQFSIPQFGDFFSDMVVHAQLSAVNSSLQNAPAQAGADVGGQFPANGENWNGADLTGAVYRLFDAFGNAITAGAANSWRNLVRYCEYPGERLLSKVKFEVNGNNLDEYFDTTAAMKRKMLVTTDKKAGYDRLIGQAVPLEGLSGPCQAMVLDSNSSGNPVTVDVTSDDVIPGALAVTTVPAIGTQNFPQVHSNPNSGAQPTAVTPAAFINAAFPQAAYDINIPTVTAAPNFSVIQKKLAAVDGLQTPKYQQPVADLWIPLQFWFNCDVRDAIPSVAIPFGQRYINLDLATQSNLVFEYPGLYVQQAIVTAPIADEVGDEVTLGGFSAKYKPYISAGVLSAQTVPLIELYVNNLFVNPEVHDIYMRKIGFNLIRVHRIHQGRTTSQNNDSQLLSQLKWAVEYMMFGLRPDWNTSTSNAGPGGTKWRDWHRMTKTFDLQCDETDYAIGVSGTGTITDSVAGAGTSFQAGFVSQIGQLVPDTWVKEVNTVETLSLKSHGSSLYDNVSHVFSAVYIPYTYNAFVTGRDEGLNIINFALIPGIKNPNGHLNVSRARENYLEWTTNYVTSTTPADVLVVAIAINFLLIADGSAVLRFST